MGIVDDAVEDGVGEGGFADDVVPLRQRQLAGDQDGGVVVSVLDDFHEIASLIGIEAVGAPIVEDQEIGSGEGPEQAGVAAVGAPPLGPGDRQSRPCGATGPTDLRQSVRQAAKERRVGCGGDLRGVVAADHALCGCEDGGTAGSGHAVRLVPPIYVKAYVQRQKNDASDAEAICEASSRPTMRFVAVKTEEQQARGMLFRTRDLLVRQRTQTINALRGHLAEFGVIAPQGPAHVGRLASALEGPASGLPEAVRELAGLLLEQIAGLDAKIAGLEREVHVSARQDEEARRLMSVPGIGPISAMAIQAFAPPMESFRRGRDFSAWDFRITRKRMAKQKETSLFYRLSTQPPLEFPKRSMDVIMPWKTRFRSVNMPRLAAVRRRSPRSA